MNMGRFIKLSQKRLFQNAQSILWKIYCVIIKLKDCIGLTVQRDTIKRLFCHFTMRNNEVVLKEERKSEIRKVNLGMYASKQNSGNALNRRQIV